MESVAAIPMACKTWLKFLSPDEQADPAETAMPRMRWKKSTEAMSGKLIFKLDAMRFFVSPLIVKLISFACNSCNNKSLKDSAPNKPICYIDQIIRWRIFFQGQIFVNLKKFLQMAINTELASQCLSKKIFIV